MCCQPCTPWMNDAPPHSSPNKNGHSLYQGPFTTLQRIAYTFKEQMLLDEEFNKLVHQQEQVHPPTFIYQDVR